MTLTFAILEHLERNSLRMKKSMNDAKGIEVNNNCKQAKLKSNVIEAKQACLVWSKWKKLVFSYAFGKKTWSYEKERD